MATLGELQFLAEIRHYDSVKIVQHFNHVVELSLESVHIPILTKNLNKLEFLQKLEINAKGSPAEFLLLKNLNSLSSLKALWLQNMPLETLPESLILLLMLPSFRELYWEDPTRNRLMYNIHNQLISLDLSNLEINFLPDCIEHLVFLQELNLMNPYITIIPETIITLQDLQYLYILPQKMIYPPTEICEQGWGMIREYIKEMKESFPRYKSRIESYEHLTENEKNYPYLSKWGPQLEELCLTHPESPSAQEIMQQLKQRSFYSLKQASEFKIWF